ncbi:MAG: hypothetical protein J0L99_12465 [Chitinophagales bacterium]|nr:hypothetical protein [Chitinophagales bacterium]
MQFPLETYLDGLRNGDPGTLEQLYRELRQPVIQAIESQGGSAADGGVFFFTALQHMALELRENRYPEGQSLAAYVKGLSLAHYTNWQHERGQTPPETLPTPDVAEVQAYLPDAAALSAMRNRLVAWRAASKLSPQCLDALQNLPLRSEIPAPQPSPDPSMPPPIPMASVPDTCIFQFAQLLNLPPEAQQDLPEWALSAVRDRAGYHYRQVAQGIENRLHQAANAAPATASKSEFAKYLVILLAALALIVGGVMLWQYLSRDEKPKQVYQDNFAPPVSIIEDMRKRYGVDFGSDSTGYKSPECLNAMIEVDVFYKKKDFHNAEQRLFEIADDPSITGCSADAFYYLAIIALQQGQPRQTLALLAKIDDLDNFGQEIYWYQSMAFLKMAETDPEMRDRAIHAVERGIGNMTDSLRRQRMEQMLRDISPAPAQ